MILMVRHEFNLGHAQGYVDACLSLYAEGVNSVRAEYTIA